MIVQKIIIDNVDVSECEYRVKDGHNGCCCVNTKENEGEEGITAYYECKYNHNCHYKQLKRKEQECENQRYKLNYYIKKMTQLLDDIDKYKQALDEIESYRVAEINDEDEEETDTILSIINNVKSND